jgi:hypothetical protein
MRRHFDSRVTRLANCPSGESPTKTSSRFDGAVDFAKRRKLLIQRHRPDIVSMETAI